MNDKIFYPALLDVPNEDGASRRDERVDLTRDGTGPRRAVGADVALAGAEAERTTVRLPGARGEVVEREVSLGARHASLPLRAEPEMS